jgi:hypothetical protein
VPHYVDLDAARARYGRTEGVRILSPLTADVEPVVTAIARCSAVLSSSLHGLIVSHADGVPALWVLFSDGVRGDGFKFRDYFTSAGLDQAPLDLRRGQALTREQLRGEVPGELPRLDLGPLRASCPWRAA